jgi:hypothetical protein
MNTYLDIIWNLSLKNQQSIDYIALCESALLRDLIDGYVEKHHMLPVCMCNDKLQIKDPTNLVTFSAKEHFLAHQLLSEMFSGIYKRKMLYALSGLCFKKNGDRVIDADEYAIVKEASRTAKKGIPLTSEHKQKIKDSFANFNPNIGRKHSDETKKKYSDAKIGTHRSDETKKKISESLNGVKKAPRTATHTANFIKARTGIPSKLKGIKQAVISCPHCDKTGGPGAMKLHHFNKCKLRVDK